MITILLAARFGVAQEAIVVYEGTETNHFVDNHPGNEYLWGVYKSLSPDIPADNDAFYFVGSNSSHEVKVHWQSTGLYYLKVDETDQAGCSNTKAIAISVLINKRSIGFVFDSSVACYSFDGNDFALPLEIKNNLGQPLASEFFPLEVRFEVDGIGYSQSIAYETQELIVTEDMFSALSNEDTQLNVKITETSDNKGEIIPVTGEGEHERTIFAAPEVEFTTVVDVVWQGNYKTHQVALLSGNAEGAQYFWSVVPENGTSTDLSGELQSTIDVLWDGPLGEYSLLVAVSDGNGCVSDNVSQAIEIVKAPVLTVNAGPDTLVGSCLPYVFDAVYPNNISYTYLWTPSSYLDDPTIPNPTFTPGLTTSYELTVTTPEGISGKDTVTISVSEVMADAGQDVSIDQGSTAMLDGSASYGEEIQYYWYTLTGEIESGGNTAYPIVSEYGRYFLQITDVFGCVSVDSVDVSRFIYAPVASDDYDTTRFMTEVIIPVLNNDYDPQGELDSASLEITLAPANGMAFVNYKDYTIHYFPNNNFSGADDFEYQVCNSYNRCDEANVYVWVSDLEFLIPEAFTPNGDNINDYFEIVGIENFPNNSISIFNRWGTVVYQSQGYGISSNPKFWDGRANVGNKSEELTTGTYYYVLDLGRGNKISGSIYLDR